VSDWLVWQLVDSALPTGLFAHSWGLESAWQHGEVPDARALEQYVEAALLQTGFGSLPFVNAVHQSPDRFEALDAFTDAVLINVVANRASRAQGRTLVATAARIWPSDALTRLEARARQGFAHAAPVSGATFHLLQLPLPVVQKAILYGTARGVLSAAVRLGIVGSYQAQRMQHACIPLLDSLAERCASLSIEDLAQTSPVNDLLQAGHDRLYSRLFQS
jgi:urease accessory protein